MSKSAAHRVGLLFGLGAASLAVMSWLHLSGALAGEKPFDGTHAGVAEAAAAAGLFATENRRWLTLVAARSGCS